MVEKGAKVTTTELQTYNKVVMWMAMSYSMLHGVSTRKSFKAHAETALWFTQKLHN